MLKNGLCKFCKPISTYFWVQNCNSLLWRLTFSNRCHFRDYYTDREITNKLCLTCFDYVRWDINVNRTYDNIEKENNVIWQTKTISQTQAVPPLDRRDIQLRFFHDRWRSWSTHLGHNAEVVLKPCIWDVVHEIHNGKHWQMASVCFHWGLRLVHLS